jgi:uncharacterized protein
VKFWDTSAVTPLCIEEPQSERMRSLYQGDTEMNVWWATRVECVSSIRRAARGGRLSPGEETLSLDVARHLFDMVIEIAPVEDIRTRAERCLAVHPLRAADALQLAAALTWAQERPTDMGFVCLDGRLREAAQREGFTVLPEALA